MDFHENVIGGSRPHTGYYILEEKPHLESSFFFFKYWGILGANEGNSRLGSVNNESKPLPLSIPAVRRSRTLKEISVSENMFGTTLIYEQSSSRKKVHDLKDHTEVEHVLQRC